MKGFTHIAAGALTGFALAQTEAPDSILLLSGISAIGGLLPDIDVGTSKIAKLCRPAAYTIQLIFGHRGVFHSLLLWVSLAAIWYFAKPDHLLWICAAAAGVGSHLFLDMFNPAGVPLLWPVPHKLSLAKFHSGGLIDILLGLLLTGICIYLLSSAIKIPAILGK